MNIAHRFEIDTTPKEYHNYDGEEIIETYLGIEYRVFSQNDDILFISNLFYFPEVVYNDQYISQQTGIVLGKTEFI